MIYFALALICLVVGWIAHDMFTLVDRVEELEARINAFDEEETLLS